MDKQQKADELAVLFPNHKMTVAGEELDIKEYTLLQQLQHRARFIPFVGTLRSSLTEAQARDEFDLDALMDCVSRHYEDVLFLVALSVGKSVEWVQALSGEEAEGLLMVWWAVNSDFFTRQAAQPLLAKMVKDHQATLAKTNTVTAEMPPIGAKSPNT